MRGIEILRTASAPCHRSSRISFVTFSDLESMRTYLSSSAFVWPNRSATLCTQMAGDRCHGRS